MVLDYPTRMRWFTPPPSGVTVPKTFTIILYLEGVRVEPAYPLSNKTINLYRNGVKVASGKTSAYGTVWLSDTITTPGSYSYFAEFPGDYTYAGCRSPTVTTIAAEALPPVGIPTVLEWVLLPPSSVEEEKSFTCSVRLMTVDGDTLAGKTVRFAQDTYGFKYASTDSEGEASFGVYIRVGEKSFICHAEFFGDDMYAPSRTTSMNVGVTTPPVIPVGEPIAELHEIRVHDNIADVWYEVYPEEKPAYCTSGKDAVHVVLGAKNVGTKDGNLWGTLIDNLGVVIIPKIYRWCAIGAFIWWEKTFNMPLKTYPLEIKMGH